MKREDQPKADGPRAQKVQQVEKLTEGLKESQAILFTDYSGLSVVEMTNLRKKLSQLAVPAGRQGAELKVAKNTLIKSAAEKAKLPLEALTGPTAVLFSRGADPIESIKAVVLSFKEKGAVKFGVFSAKASQRRPASGMGGPASGREWDLLDAAKILELARLPARAVLESRLVGALNSPVAKFVLTLKGTQRSLVAVLSEISKTRGGGQ